MRFIFDPTDGALIPEIIKHGIDATTDTVLDGISHVVLNWLNSGWHWLTINGIPLTCEGLLIWGMICLLMGTTGNGKWLEKGAKSLLFSVLLGLVRYAI